MCIDMIEWMNSIRISSCEVNSSNYEVNIMLTRRVRLSAQSYCYTFVSSWVNSSRSWILWSWIELALALALYGFHIAFIQLNPTHSTQCTQSSIHAWIAFCWKSMYIFESIVSRFCPDGGVSVYLHSLSEGTWNLHQSTSVRPFNSIQSNPISTLIQSNPIPTQFISLTLTHHTLSNHNDQCIWEIHADQSVSTLTEWTISTLLTRTPVAPLQIRHKRWLLRSRRKRGWTGHSSKCWTWWAKRE